MDEFSLAVPPAPTGEEGEAEAGTPHFSPLRFHLSWCCVGGGVGRGEAVTTLAVGTELIWLRENEEAENVFSTRRRDMASIFFHTHTHTTVQTAPSPALRLFINHLGQGHLSFVIPRLTHSLFLLSLSSLSSLSSLAFAASSVASAALGDDLVRLEAAS